MLTLTREELFELTGRKRPSGMMAWLDSRNWIYEPPARAGDVPKVAKAYFTARMTGAEIPGRRAGPRLDFMNR